MSYSPEASLDTPDVEFFPSAQRDTRGPAVELVQDRRKRIIDRRNYEEINRDTDDADIVDSSMDLDKQYDDRREQRGRRSAYSNFF